MEENQEPNNDWKTVGGPGPDKKKKGLGPLKGTLLAILIVFLICVIGLLIRMEVAGDGDYFAPFKKIFGIEEDSDKEEKKETKKTSGKSKERLSLLSSDAKKSGVKHYNLTISLKDVLDMAGQMQDIIDEDNIKDMIDVSNSNTNAKISKLSDENINDYSEIQPRSMEPYGEDEYGSDEYYDDWNYDDQIDPINILPDEDDDYYGSDDSDFVHSYFDMLDTYYEYIDGEFYIDLYAKGNEVVQLVLGLDYMPIVENYYNKAVEEGISEVESFDSAEDFAEYMAKTLKLALNKQTLVESLEDEFGSSYGITEEELSELIDINIDTGLLEIYFNLNDDLNEELADFIAENEDEIEELGIDADNIFETGVPVFNKQMKDEGYGIFKITVE